LARDKNKFIGNLVADLKPVRPLPSPGVRTGLWYALVVTATVMITYGVQEFRPNFWEQLTRFPRLDFELVTGAAWVLVLFYSIFVSNIPGEKISPAVKTLNIVLSSLFAGSVITGFFMESPEASRLGSRSLCDVEVLIYGGGALAGFLFLLQRGIIVSDRWDRWRVGWAAGLVSALTMQLACMYDPLHGLLFHFGPAFILALLGGYAIQFMKKHTDKKARAFIDS